MADYIPLKVQTEIMKRLPVISLIQCRSVSKKWKSVIDSPEFIGQHCVIQHHTQSQHHLLLSYLVSVSGMGMIPRYSSIVDDDTFPHQIQKVSMTTPLAVQRLNPDTNQLVGVSAGLFCFYGSASITQGNAAAVLWNPSIKKTVTIPVPNVLDGLPFATMVGFSVCPRTHDPKLVKITYISRYHMEFTPTVPIPNQVEVFSLSSGLWKPLPTGKLPRKPILYIHPQVAINDSIYWLAYDKSHSKDEYSRFIMSFDFTTQEFTEVHLPPTLASSNTHDVSISMLNQSVVVIEKSTPHSSPNVWIMHNAHPPSFIHMFTINMPISSTRDVAGFTNNGSLLLSTKQTVKKNQLIVCNNSSVQINHTGISGPFHQFFAAPYTQTLLLLHHNHSVDADGIGNQGTPTQPFPRLVNGVTTSSSSATSSPTPTSYYYGAAKRCLQEQVHELARKKRKIFSRRVSACVNKKFDNLLIQLSNKGITLDKTLVIGKEDDEEDYQHSYDEALQDADDGTELKDLIMRTINDALA